MVILMGVEVVAIGAVASRFPTVRNKVYKGVQTVRDYMVGDGTEVANASSAGTESPVRVRLHVSPGPRRREPRQPLRPLMLPVLHGPPGDEDPDGGGGGALRLEPVLEQLAHSVPRQYGDVGAAWHLLFSTASDGRSLPYLLHKCAAAGPVLLLVTSDDGRAFGVFCSEALREPSAARRPSHGEARPPLGSTGYYGGGESFLFAMGSLSLPPPPERQVSSPAVGGAGRTLAALTYPWARGDANMHFVISDGERIAFGAGGSSAGLALDADLARGSSGGCHTFANPPLPAVATPIAPLGREAAAASPTGVPAGGEAAAAAASGGVVGGGAGGGAGGSGSVEFGVAAVEVWGVCEHTCRGMRACRDHVPLPLRPAGALFGAE